jgi:hypothetical protein
VVGNTRFCNFPPEAVDLPEIGGFSASSISSEAIIGLESDLVIAGTARQQPVVEQLEALGVTVVVLAPASFDAVYTSILQLGTLTGTSAQVILGPDSQGALLTVDALRAAVPAEHYRGDPLSAGAARRVGRRRTCSGRRNDAGAGAQPPVDPYLLGVSSGASLGAVAVILLGFSGARWDYLGLPALALLFGTLYLTVQARSLLPT